MKLEQFEHRGAYLFSLIFSNGVHKEIDLSQLISKHVALTEVDSARIDAEWGCLEFKDGSVDIEPKMLYQWAESRDLCHH